MTPPRWLLWGALAGAVWLVLDPRLGEWVARSSPHEILAALVSFPGVLLVALWMIGPETLRRLIDELEEISPGRLRLTRQAHSRRDHAEEEQDHG